VVQALLGSMLRWPPLEDPAPGYSVILCAPWDLRHLLSVNLMFVERLDLARLHRIHVVFDRRWREGADEVIARTRERFPSLPLEFHALDPLPGWTVERIGSPGYFHGMACYTALRHVSTRYAVLHDFDLYPVA